jgi:hypothetical protein
MQKSSASAALALSMNAGSKNSNGAENVITRAIIRTLLLISLLSRLDNGVGVIVHHGQRRTD